MALGGIAEMKTLDEDDIIAAEEEDLVESNAFMTSERHKTQKRKSCKLPLAFADIAEMNTFG